MTDWPLIIGILGFLFGVVTAVGGYMFRAGGHAAKIGALEGAQIQAEADIKAIQQQLARGDARFATLTEKIGNMEKTLDEIKQLLTDRPAKRTRATEGN